MTGGQSGRWLAEQRSGPGLWFPWEQGSHMPTGDKAGARLPLHRGVWDWPSLPGNKGREGAPRLGTAVGSSVLVRGSVGPRRHSYSSPALGLACGRPHRVGAPRAEERFASCVDSSVCLQKTTVQGESKTNSVTHDGHANKS